MKPSARIRRRWALLVILLAGLLAACSPAAARPASAPAAATAAAAKPTATLPAAQILSSAVPYKTVKIPGPGNASLELPEDWRLWGNGGWFSPDGGQTLGGLRLVFQKRGQDAGRLLYNEGAVLIDQSPVTIGAIQATRYKLQSFMTNAASGQRVLEGYELIYAVPLADEGLLAGAFIRAPALADLDKWEPVVRHMAESLKAQGD